MSRGRIVFGAVAVFSLAGAALSLATHRNAPAIAPTATSHLADGGPAAAAVVGRATPRAPDPALDRLARAYADLGVAQDGGHVATTTPADDDLASAARELLALDRAHRGGSHATLGTGTRLSINAGATGEGAAGDRTTDAAAHGDHGATIGTAAIGADGGGRAAIAEADDALALGGTALPDPAQALRETVAGPVLRQPGLWADRRYRPDAQPDGLRITDASGGGYVVRILTDRPERLRLDGGLIVPGRFYRVSGSAWLTGDVAAGVEIRPLAAVPLWHEAPPAPPHGSG